MGCCCCHLSSGSYAQGLAGWSCSIAKSCSLLLSKTFTFGQIGRQGVGFDAWCASRLAGGIIRDFDKGRADGLAGPVGSLAGTLGTGDCGYMEHVICLLSSIWGLETLGGACTLGTCCMLHDRLGLWFPQIFWDVPVSEPVLCQ